MKNLLTKIYDFFRYDLPYGIENLIVWFPAVWNDRQWGDFEIFTILRHKLKLTEKNFCQDDNHNHTHALKNIRRCIAILDRLIEDVYYDFAFKELHKRWGKPRIVYKEDGTIRIKYPKVKTPEDEEQKEREWRRACAYEDMLEEADREELFEIMKGNIREWWN